jgi:hypothetical protein
MKLTLSSNKNFIKGGGIVKTRIVLRSLLVKIFQNSILKTSKKMDGASENSMKFKIKITNQSKLDFSKVIQI